MTGARGAGEEPGGGRPGGLRRGFSTGTAAAAAAKAALMFLLTGRRAGHVDVTLPGGQALSIPLDAVKPLEGGMAEAVVIKDAGDDPDVTHKAAIVARVCLGGQGGAGVVIKGGPGVGRVTRPGLPVEVGGPAINPVPRRMILWSLTEAWLESGREGEPRLSVEISAPQGERLARRTLNPRLGIVGGISILGTHGLVKPFSHEAYTATIDSALSVARSMGLFEIVFTTGGKSEKRAMAMRPELPEAAFVQIADFYAYALRGASGQGFKRVGVVSFFGKAVKQAMGLEYTHAHKNEMDLAPLGQWLRRAGGGPDLCSSVARANTARHALEMIKQAGREDLAAEVGERLLQSARGFLGPGPELWAAIIDFGEGVLFEGDEQGRPA